MDKLELSKLMQRAKGTYIRNQYIRWLHRQGKNNAEIGREHNLSRQMVRKIINEAE